MHNELLFLFAAKQITLYGIIDNVKTMVEIKKEPSGEYKGEILCYVWVCKVL